MVLESWVGPAVALLVVSVLAFLAFRLYGRRADGEGAASRLRRALAVGLPAVAVLSVLALLVAGVADAVAVTLAAAGVGSPLATPVLLLLAASVGVVVATTAGYAGALPAALDVRDLDVRRGLALRRFVRWTGAVVGSVAVLLLVTLRVAAITGTALLPVVVAVVGLVYLTAPRLGRLGTPTRPTTPDERRRLEGVLADADFRPHDVYVFETANERPGASIRGPVGRRTLFVADHLLDAYDDEAVGVVVAANANRARRFHTEYRMVVGVGSVLAAYWAASASPWPLPALGVVSIVAAVLLWYGSRLAYAADAETAGRFGRATVAETYRAVADDADLGGGRVQAFLRMRPRMRDRIDRLAGGS